MNLDRILKYWAWSWGYFAVSLTVGLGAPADSSTGNLIQWRHLQSYIYSELRPLIDTFFDPLIRTLAELASPVFIIVTCCWLGLGCIMFPVAIAAPFAAWATYLDPAHGHRVRAIPEEADDD